MRYRVARAMFGPMMAPDGGTDGGTGGEGGTNSGADDDKGMSFDDFLKSGGNQAEFDRRINKAVNKAVTAAKEKWDLLADEKASEAEKLAKMTEAEKAAYKISQKEKELADREKKIARSEMKAEALKTLTEQNLPAALADMLDYTDAEKCSASIKTVGKAFNDAVQTAVNEKLKGGKPPKKPEQETVTKEKYAKMGYTERLKLKTENPELYKQLAGV